MRCGRCGNNFDEEMYSGICPKCGHFNNRRAEYDVSKYFSAKFDDGGKVSTQAQAAKQHEQLHRTYDSVNMHKQAGVPLGKPNPYQQTTAKGGTYQAKPQGKSAAYGKSAYPVQGQYKRPNPRGETKTKNIVTPICAVIAVLAIMVTVFSVQMKKRSLAELYHTLDYEQEYVEAGEIFEIHNRLLLVDKAEVIDTSQYPNLTAGEKLVAVTVEILPADDEKRDGKYMSDTVYVSDGYHCKQYLDSYVVDEFLDVQDVLTGYDYLNYGSIEGVTGRFYFFVNNEADEIVISFDEDREEETMFILERRVSVPLQLEEEEP